MVSLSTKRRGVAVVAVLTLGLLFGIALLMMQHALPIAETNFSSSGTTVSMTLHTLTTAYSDTTDDFVFVNTVNGKAVAQYEVSQPGRVIGESKTVSLALNEELGGLFCLCSTGDDAWKGELSDFKVNDVSFPGVVTTLKLSTNDDGYYPCWQFGIESNELVDKGYSQDCSLSNTVSMSLRTLTETDSATSADFVFINTAQAKEVAQYEISQPGSVEGQSKTVSVELNEQLGNMFCLCSNGEDSWNGELSDFKVGGVSFPGEVTNLKLSKNGDYDYYPCWRFGIEYDRLTDKGHYQDCSVPTNTVFITLYTTEESSDKFEFVNTVNGVATKQYDLYQPGTVEGGSKMVSVFLTEELGQLFCLCTTGDDAWNGELTDFLIGGLSFPVMANSLKLSTDDPGYYPCWRFGIESEVLMDKGHSETCS